MRRVKEHVPLDECKRRALAYMRTLDRRELVKASSVAQAIWPDAEFITAQGAGAAASRILSHLQNDGLVEWTSTTTDWGWRIGRRKP